MVQDDHAAPPQATRKGWPYYMRPIPTPLARLHSERASRV